MKYEYLLVSSTEDIETIETALDNYELTGKHKVCFLYGLKGARDSLIVSGSDYLQDSEYKVENGHAKIPASTFEKYTSLMKTHMGIESDADLSQFFFMTLISGESFQDLSYVDPIYYGTEAVGGKRFAEFCKKTSYFGGFIGLDHKMLVEYQDHGDVKRWVMPVIAGRGAKSGKDIDTYIKEEYSASKADAFIERDVPLEDGSSSNEASSPKRPR